MCDDHFHILSPSPVSKEKNDWKPIPAKKKTCVLCPCRVAVRHVKVKPRCAVLTMLKRLDKIRFRGPRTRDDFPDLAESPPASDNECSDDMQLKPRTALRDTEDLLRDPVSNFFSFLFFYFFYYAWVYVLPFFPLSFCFS